MKRWGKKIRLRDMTLEDVKLMCNWENGIDILFADYNFPKMTIGEQLRWFNMKNGRISKCFVVEDRENQLIGYIAMKQINAFLKTAELGVVMSPTKVGMGYGTEAIKIFMEWYFLEYKFKKLWLRVGAYNKRAIKAYQNLGFKFKKEYYSQFSNKKVNPLKDEGFDQYKNCFRIKAGQVQARCYIMENTRYL